MANDPRPDVEHAMKLIDEIGECLHSVADKLVARERERAARICESMVIGGHAWTEEQAIAAKALLAAAKNIRDTDVLPHEGLA